MIYLGLHSKWQNWDLKSINSNLNQYTVPPPRFLLGRINTWWLSHDKWVAKAYLQPGTIPKSSSTAWLSPALPHYLLFCSLKGLWEIIKVHLRRDLGVPQKCHVIWRHPPTVQPNPGVSSWSSLNLCLPNSSKLVSTSDCALSSKQSYK